MISSKHILSTTLLLVAISFAQAQKTPSSILEAKGNTAYANLLYADALTYYKKAKQSAKTEEASVALSAKIADCYWLVRNYDSAYRWYASLPADRVAANTTEKVRLAELSANNGQYNVAANSLSNVSGYATRAAGYKNTPKMLRDSAEWKVQYLDGINTDYFREFSPLLVNGSLIWTTNQPKRYSQNGIMGWDNMGYNRLMKVQDMQQLNPTAVSARQLVDASKIDSNRPDRLSKQYELADVELLSRVTFPASLLDKLKKIQTFSIPVVSAGKLKYNVAHASYDSATQGFFMSANLQGKIKDATRMVAIASSTLNGAVFSEPKLLLDLSTEYSNMHPAIHPNGNLIVFSSNRAAGVGGFDLYSIQKDENGNWSSPVLVSGLNTIGNELFPTFGVDGKFYFSSDVQPGLGGLDIYAASFNNGVVQDITHLSFPLNSAYDDFGLTIAADGQSGYFSSDRLGTDDVFKFEKQKKLIPIQGIVTSMATKAGKPNVDVTIIEKNELPALTQLPINKKEMIATLGTISLKELLQGSPDAVIETVKSDASGKYSFAAKPNRNYIIRANDGVNPEVSVNVNTNGVPSKVNADVIALNDITPEETKKVFETKQFIVYFKFDKTDIRQHYADTLDQVAALMKANPEVICTLGGHTDQYGTDPYNDKLSDKRVINVRAYLEKAGIGANRILTGSYGEKKLIQPYKNIEKNEINRRVEIILSVK